MNRLTRQQELAIIIAWLLGDGRDKVASDLDVSGSTVSAVVAHLPAALLELRELNQYFRKLGVSALTLSLVFKEILQHGEGLSVEELPKLVAYAIKASKDSNHEIEAVVSADHRLSRLEEQAGKTYPEAISEYEAKTAVSKRLDEENAKKLENNRKLEEKGLKFKKENAEARREHRRILHQSHLTERDIVAFNNVERQLSEFELNFEDAEMLAKYIGFVKRSNCPPQEFSRMVQEYMSVKEAVCTANSDLQEMQLKQEATKADTASIRWAADREQERFQKYKYAGDYWQNRANYFIQTAKWWEAHLNKVIADTQKQQCYHDAIIEQIIKNQKMNPETAAEYRRLKKVDLIHQNFQEYIRTLELNTLQKIAFAVESHAQQNSEAFKPSLGWFQGTNLKEG